MVDYKSLVAFVTVFILSDYFAPAALSTILGRLLVTGVVTVVIPYVFSSQLRSQEKVSATGKAVFITGCDTGFGHELAIKLDKLGFHVFAGCLLPEKEGATSLRQTCSNKLQVVHVDVTSEQLVNEALTAVQQALNGNELWAIVNNAGIAVISEVELCPMDWYDRMMAVNTMGTVRVTKAFLPLLRESAGRIVIVASVAGRMTYAGFSAYSMSKHAVISFANALRVEMKKWGISVHTIEPSLYRTPITSITDIKSLAEHLWKETPASIREAYGEDYYQAYNQVFSNIQSYTSNNVYEVIEDMMHAVTAKDTQSRYMPSALIRLRIAIALNLPDSWLDKITMKMVSPKCAVAFKKGHRQVPSSG
ncbi:PREDICTED: estradiol 17-beta-dehydrogenase 2-like [Priapulus caudatus]|uniref:Estradiol 17-beta-dehydrogenase 2-like n=1 Tax=Priapulus caudatus TaxID=37621 RepID=A0ABM1E6D4_PRICU|nr:PREDICTED: estradiol 17-beta-dehydrogenase 2-like [Priapulus caudatus]